MLGRMHRDMNDEGAAHLSEPLTGQCSAHAERTVSLKCTLHQVNQTSAK